MEYAISIKLTEKQFHVIKEMARGEYRTIGNTLAMLAATGFSFYIQDNGVYIKKRDEDRSPDKDDFQYYKDDELVQVFDSIPFIQ